MLHKVKSLSAACTLMALTGALVAPFTASAQTAPPRLLVWINGDKGYDGLQKVGDRFSQISGVQVVVQHPEGAPDKFGAAAAAGKGPDIFCWPHDRAGEPDGGDRQHPERCEHDTADAGTVEDETERQPLHQVDRASAELQESDLHDPDSDGRDRGEQHHRQRRRTIQQIALHHFG